MPLIKVKLFENDSVTDLNTAIAAYKAGVGSELLTSQRGAAVSEFTEPDGDRGLLVALAHGGLDIPVTKLGDLQHAVVMKDGSLADLQGAVDAGLAATVHNTVADGVTTAPGVLTSATIVFEAEDVGRKLRIGTVEKTITVFNSATSVNYDVTAGSFVAGVAQTVSLLGAEVLQSLHQSISKSPAGKFRMTMAMAVNGQLP